MIVSFSQLLNADNFGKDLTVKAVIYGKSDQAYSVPKTIKILCNKKKCPDHCPAQPNKSFFINSVESIVKFIDVRDNNLIGIIKSIMRFITALIESVNSGYIFINSCSWRTSWRLS